MYNFKAKVIPPVVLACDWFEDYALCFFYTQVNGAGKITHFREILFVPIHSLKCRNQTEIIRFLSHKLMALWMKQLIDVVLFYLTLAIFI